MKLSKLWATLFGSAGPVAPSLGALLQSETEEPGGPDRTERLGPLAPIPSDSDRPQENSSALRIGESHPNCDDDLIQAAISGDAEEAATALGRGADANAVNEGGNSALQLAARYGHVEVVRTLVRMGAALDAANSAGDTALRWAESGLSRAYEDEDEEYKERFLQVIAVLNASDSGRPRMFEPGASVGELLGEIVKHLTAGAEPSAIEEQLISDLDIPQDVAAEMIASGSQLAAAVTSRVLQHTIDQPHGPIPPISGGSYTEEELVQLESFEVPLPSGDGRCSDNDCPCPAPGTLIPHGSGFLYIDEAAVEFRSDARTAAALEEKGQRIQAEWASRGVTHLIDPQAYRAILVCEQGARRRGLDLGVAAEDARLAWSQGRAPLRPTPKGAS